MASMNPNLILQASQGADILGAFSQGNALAGQVNDQRRQNALAGFLGQNAGALMQGDQNALAQYAQYDPQGAMDMMSRQQDRQWRMEDRAYARERDAAQDARLAKLDARDDEKWQWELAGQVEKMDEASRLAEADKIDKGLAGAAHFYQTGNRSGYEGFLRQQGMDPAQFPFDDFPAHAAQFETARDIYKGMRPGAGAEYGLNPIYGRDADGKVVVMQLGKDGRAVASVIPEGITPDLGVQSQERAAGSARGKAEGEAQAQLPGAYTEAEHVIGLVDDLINDPYLPNMVGPMQGRLPNMSGDAARVQSRMDQVTGQGFMAARAFLKGQGQITDFESKRAEAAMARMSAAQSYADYVDALREFQDAVRVGVMKAQQAAGQSPTGQRDQGAGDLSDDDYLKSLGLE